MSVQSMTNPRSKSTKKCAASTTSNPKNITQTKYRNNLTPVEVYVATKVYSNFTTSKSSHMLLELHTTYDNVSGSSLIKEPYLTTF